jgi:hypothetical protein
LKTLLNAKLEVQDIYTDAQIDQFIANEYTNISNTLTPLIDQKLNSSSYTPSQFATRADPTLTGNITLDGDNIRDLIETKLMQCVSRKISCRARAPNLQSRACAPNPCPLKRPKAFFIDGVKKREYNVRDFELKNSRKYNLNLGF